MIDRILAYENGELTEEDEVVSFFQDLIDSGLADRRAASDLIRGGYCHA